MTHPLVRPAGRWMSDVLSDGEVVRRVRAGETELFELLLRRHNQRLFRTVRSRVQDDDEAQEVLQVAYVRAWRALDGFEDRASFVTWMSRIAVRTAGEVVATRRRRREIEGASAAEADLARHHTEPPDEVAEGTELARLLERSIDALPERYRLVLVLRLVQGLTTEEVARALELGEETIKVRLHRAREKLRRGLLEKAEREGLLASAWGFDGERCDAVVAGTFARIRRETEGSTEGARRRTGPA